MREDGPVFTAYITRYALTGGILRIQARVSSIGEGRMIVEEGRRLNTFHKPHWHETWEAAQAFAEDMRRKKLLSLDKQKRRLMALDFSPPRHMSTRNSAETTISSED